VHVFSDAFVPTAAFGVYCRIFPSGVSTGFVLDLFRAHSRGVKLLVAHLHQFWYCCVSEPRCPPPLLLFSADDLIYMTSKQLPFITI